MIFIPHPDRTRMRSPSLLRSLAVALLAAPALGAQAPAPRRLAPDTAHRLTLANYLDWEDVQDAKLSPDGRRIVYTRRWIDKANDRWENALWIMDADGGHNRFLVNGSGADWSPDGRRIAYLGRGDGGTTQLFVKYLDEEGATQITRVDQTPEAIAWAPDGKSIAFRMLVLVKDRVSMESRLAALRPKDAKWTEAPRVVEKLDYRADRQGFVDDGFKHLFVVNADGGTPRQLTAGDWDDGTPEWAPDSRTIVFSGKRMEDADWRIRESDIYAVDVASGAVKQLTTHKGPDGNPKFSPDGRSIAYTALDSSDATWQDAKLAFMNADGSSPRVLAPELDRTPTAIFWAADGKAIYFTAENEGSRNLYVASPGGGPARQVTTGTQVLTVTDIGRNGLAVGVRSTAREPTDVVAFDLKAPRPRRLTNVNDDVLTGKTLGDVDEIWYTSNDGTRIQGWIIKPPQFDPHRRYPLMLSIHGGPHSMYNVGFNFAWQEHAANDYVVLYTNPRGSTGYGSAFGNAIKNAYPGKDFDDLMVGVDSVIRRGYVDSTNMFVYGCSGGGVLTAWTVGHTDRFRAAASMCPVIDWVSFVGTTDGPFWYYNFAKLPWEDPSEHLRRSPLMYVGNVKTPTMLMTGVQDLRTPISQTEEFYQALKLRKVPTMMVRMNGEWHGTSSKPSNFLRTQLFLRSWFEKWGTQDDAAPRVVQAPVTP